MIPGSPCSPLGPCSPGRPCKPLGPDGPGCPLGPSEPYDKLIQYTAT